MKNYNYLLDIASDITTNDIASNEDCENECLFDGVPAVHSHSPGQN